MYLGNTPTQQGFTPAVDYFSGNGSTTAFTLSRQVASVAQVEAVIENVVQSPVDAFTVSGNTITFTSAPPSGSNNIYVRYTSPITQVMQPSDNSVGQRQLNSDLQNATYGYKNRIINGAMMIDQRNAGASITQNTSAQFPVDRFLVYGTVTSKFSAQQNAGAVSTPLSFTKYLGATSLSAYSVLSGDRFFIAQNIEGFNTADLSWGYASAQTATLSFWVRSSLTGSFGGSLKNGTGTRSYPFSYTINAANTWEFKTITVAGDTTGTWATDNSAGVTLIWNLGCGSVFSGTAGAWAAGNLDAPTGATSVVGTNGATFYITGVQLEKGSTATSFDYRPYGTELALCQRYCYAWSDATTSTNGFLPSLVYQGNAAVISTSRTFPISMRAVPTSVTQSIGGSITWTKYDNTGGVTKAVTDAAINVRGGSPIIGELNYTAATAWGSVGTMGFLAMSGTPAYGYLSAEL